MIIKNGKRIDGCTDTLPVGTVQPFLGLTPPKGYLVCQGQLISKAEYPELYNICKSAFGAETSTHFYLPDLRGKTIAGYDDNDTAMNSIGKLLGNISHKHVSPLTWVQKNSSYYVGVTNSQGTSDVTGKRDFYGSVTNEFYGRSNNLADDGWAVIAYDTSVESSFQPTVVMNWIVKAAMLIPEYFIVENTLTSTSTSNALSAAQGKILNNSVNELQTSVNNIKTQITHDFMVLGFSGAESTWTEDGVWVPVGFGAVKSSSGSKLINSMPNVKIGKGVSKVRVFVQLTYYQQSADDYMFLAITKNGTNQAKSIQAMAQWGQITVDYVLSVKEGDLIGAQVYKDNDGGRIYLQDFTSFTSAPCNYLLVEVIE
jgi:microcystin-dependent protein